MPYRITDNCISCGDCVVACEKGAIDDSFLYNSSRNAGASTSFRIIESACDDCGFCVGVCPAGAIIKIS